MYMEPLTQAIHVVGIELRTSNLEAMQTIPPHWQRFSAEGVLGQITGRLSDEVYAVYTHFENAGSNNQGLYSLVIGAAVPASACVPPGMVRVVVPASKRAVFAVEPGRQDLVGPKWMEIWARTDLPKTYIAEFERYSPDGTIQISIGL
ncbi:GyrI-like domain-containing protein [Rhodoferax mekongensis]|uniref:GyrI-like domain-containing protein n=1 Tax=Rhodoferax mekongensis TaxID=3068341 RepID=UPI0028BD34A6|nr:effector binding domain-containing protein [Rhodoferax sp. TBRC 17199]MDT7513615.1 effector binding domain-containing protein [Rhodoferax sp. TBRC 17199]